jgi:hypothetical protein
VRRWDLSECRSKAVGLQMAEEFRGILEPRVRSSYRIKFMMSSNRRVMHHLSEDEQRVVDHVWPNYLPTRANPVSCKRPSGGYNSIVGIIDGLSVRESRPIGPRLIPEIEGGV